MKRLPVIAAALLALCATTPAQTLKGLFYNTTNGQVVYSGTNPLTFTNAPRMAGAFFTNAAVTSSSNYILSIGLTNNGFTGMSGGPSDIAYRREGVILWEGSSTGLRFPSGATVSSTLNFNYGAGSLGVISFSGIDAATGRAISRTNLGLGAGWLTNTVAADFRAAIGLGSAATNATADFQPASAALTNLAGNNAANLTNFPALLLRTNGSAAGLTNFPTLNQNTTGTASNVTGVVAIANGGTGATNASNARTALGLGETNNVTFSNVTANGTLTVGSIATTAPVSWALDAVQTGADTNGVLDLPLTANVLRITNANTISAITNGRLGAFYFLLNQSGTNLVISNSATITARGATNLTLGANQSATLISTTATNATVH